MRGARAQRVTLKPSKLVRRLGEGLDAVALRSANGQERQVTDYRERRQSAELVAKLKGHLRPDTGVNVQLNHLISNVPEDWRDRYIVTPEPTADREDET